MSAFWLALASLFPIMNPFAALPVFGDLTGSMDTRARNRTALTTGIAVVVILLVSAFGGRYLLQALGVSLPALQIAGGIVVGGTGLAMVTGASNRMRPAEKKDSETRTSIGVVPMAIPMIAGPGAISVMIAIGSRQSDIPSFIGIGVAAVAMAVLVFVVLRFGDPLLTKLGATGLGVLTRIFGLVILAIAVELVTKGMLQVFPELGHGASGH